MLTKTVFYLIQIQKKNSIIVKYYFNLKELYSIENFSIITPVFSVNDPSEIFLMGLFGAWLLSSTIAITA